MTHIKDCKAQLIIDGEVIEIEIADLQITHSPNIRDQIVLKAFKREPVETISFDIETAPIEGYTIYRGGPNGEYHRIEDPSAQALFDQMMDCFDDDELASDCEFDQDHLDALRYMMQAIMPGSIPDIDIDDEEDDMEWLVGAKKHKSAKAGYIAQPGDITLPIGIPDIPYSIDGVNTAFPTDCAHVPKEYHGLFESYKYCSKCDKRLD
jgi:hypothetical protein